jgi:hypothetical protein
MVGGLRFKMTDPTDGNDMVFNRMHEVTRALEACVPITNFNPQRILEGYGTHIAIHSLDL